MLFLWLLNYLIVEFSVLSNYYLKTFLIIKYLRAYNKLLKCIGFINIKKCFSRIIKFYIEVKKKMLYNLI